MLVGGGENRSRCEEGENRSGCEGGENRSGCVEEFDGELKLSFFSGISVVYIVKPLPLAAVDVLGFKAVIVVN